MKYLLIALVTLTLLSATASAGEVYRQLQVEYQGTPTVTLQHTVNQTDLQGQVVKLQ